MKRARHAGGLALIALVRCTTYGADPDPTLAPERDAGQTSDAASPTGDGSTNGIEDGSALDGNADGGDAAPACTLLKEGDTCSAASHCCSNKCNEARRCAATCNAGGTACDPTSTTDCCVGLWCNSNAQCAACIASAQPAAKPAGIPLASSCCSRALQPATDKCM